TYNFRVRATNLAGDSAPSNTVSARPMPPLPTAPSGLSATAGDGQVRLNWTASATPNVYYWIEYQATGGAGGTRPKDPVGTCCTFTVHYLTDGVTYRFRVRATNLAGDSGPSNTDTAKPMPPIPQKPAWLIANPNGVGTIQLTWAASSTPRVMY